MCPHNVHGVLESTFYALQAMASAAVQKPVAQRRYFCQVPSATKPILYLTMASLIKQRLQYVGSAEAGA
jgi:hypothetical protein